MTNQQVLDRVWEVFIVQKSPQCLVDYKCSYGPPGTVGCAIGCCLPEGIRQKVYEWDIKRIYDGRETGVAELVRAFPETEDIFHDCRMGFLESLQTWHDSGINLRELEDIARSYDLQIPTV